MAAVSIPVLWGGNLPETLRFYQTLGYTVTVEQTRPYTYGVVTRDGFDLHLGPTPKDLTAEQAYISCLVLRDEVESLHGEFTAALRAEYGRVPARGTPRITRFRPGQTRFTVVDPCETSSTGNRWRRHAVEPRHQCPVGVVSDQTAPTMRRATAA
ncbi:hypothetical protein [Nocardia sp. NPDC127526]|uniref:hypothetical protein n=1 Tax=Nocardia sp. NPDC127526 TaxID=3345393 RepID=UPI00362A8C94